MIVLLNCSINLFANNKCDSTYLSTGEVVNRNDSVLIAYDDLRIVNSKLVQLEYEQEVNNNLRSIIKNDSIIIKDYQKISDNLNKDCKKYIHQRNIAIGAGALFFITSILLLLK